MRATPTLAAAVAALCATSLSSPIVAETVETAPVVVTATRTARTADETLASVTVITRRDIERAQPESVDELLRTLAGVDVSRNGGYGKTTNVYLRGTNAGHVLVLVDGIRAASATLGSFAWSNLSPDQIERIEIVRGPRASLYGSDAIGGVIQIFTRRPAHARIQGTLGSNRLWKLEVADGLEAGGWHLGFSAGRLDDGGIPVLDRDTVDRGYRNTHFTAGAEGRLPGEIALDLRVSQQRGRNELDPFTGDLTFTNRVIRLALDQEVTDTWTQRITLGHALDRSTSESPTSPATIRTRRRQFGWQHDLALGEALATVGIDHWVDHATKDRSGAIDRRIRTNALYLQWQQPSPIGDWQAALRHDRNSASGNRTTWNLGWGRDLDARTRVRLSHGTAFKAPTVNDLYWPHREDTFFGAKYITQGNPGLRPERSRTTEFGLRHRIPGLLEGRVNLYYTRVRDLIEWTTTQTGPSEYTTTPANRSKVRIRGLELTLTAHHAGWQEDFQFTLLDAKNPSGRQLDRRPLHKASLTLAHAVGRGSLQLEILGVSARLDQNGAKRLGGYGLVNLRYAQPLPGHLQFRVRAENLFDKSYSEAASFSGNYRALGRALYASLVWQP